ncbi:transcription initiation at TATA-containing promoter protein [Diaporthe eres]|uniref:Transcription initiation at TATA-containing promoter protein n=1 Tax=Diaporthe eres TaxID=83184 RepID=A0ABR1NXD1_DIAER
MSAQAPRQSPLERAKAEMNTLSQDFQKDLDNLREAPLKQYETRTNSLRKKFQASQELAIKHVENAFNASDQRIHGLENNLRAEKALLQDARKRLLAKKTRLLDTMRHLRAEKELTRKVSAERETAKAKYEETKAELDAVKVDREEARSGLQKARTELDEAKHGPASLQKDLEAVKQQNAHLQKVVDAAEQRRMGLVNELAAVRKHEADLKAELNTAKERVSAVENGLNASQSSFNRFKECLDDLVDSYKQQPTKAQPASGSAPPNGQQDSVEESIDGPQRRGHQAQAQTLDSHPENSTSKEADLLLCQTVLEEVMHKKHQKYNRHFLKPVDSVNPGMPKPLNATTRPNDLDTMKEKLAKGIYASATSFKADFNLLIAISKYRPLGHPVRIAGQRLLDIFEEQWSATRVADHGPEDHTSQGQQSRGHKRKASTERPMQSEGAETATRDFSVPPLNNHASQPSRPSSDGGLTTRQTQSPQASNASASSTGTAAGVWRGHVILGPKIQVDAKVDAVVKQVSVVKPVNTFDASFKDLFPDKLEVQGRVTIACVEEELQQLNFTPDRDMITFRIEQALDANNTDFNRLFDYFTRRERHGTVSYAGGHNVSKVYLIPVSAGSHYPEYISSLDYKELPGDLEEKILLLVVVFQIKEEVKEQIRISQDAAIKAVRSADVKDLAVVRNHLRHHPLPVLKPGVFVVSGFEQHMPMLNKIMHSRTPAGPKVAASPEGFFRLSYANLAQSGRSSIDGVKLPKCIFILGRVISPTKHWTLLVVDMEHDERPLWGILNNRKHDSWLGRFMILMRSTFPFSLDEWESTITMDHQTNQLKKRLRLNGLKIERYRSSD